MPPVVGSNIVKSLVSKGLMDAAEAPRAAPWDVLQLPPPARPRTERSALDAALAVTGEIQRDMLGQLAAGTMMTAEVHLLPNLSQPELADHVSEGREGREPRPGTKQRKNLGLLQCEEVASNLEIAEQTGWKAHSVRGFLATLRRRGMPVDVVAHHRAAGASADGAGRSCTVYRLAREMES